MLSETKSWHGSPERVDRVLVDLGLARTRSQAAHMIDAESVQIDGHVASKAGTKVPTGAIVSTSEVHRYVSRAAHKLIAALDTFDVSVTGRISLDLGASTGGFTQVLLERGASLVVALDVGHSQLADDVRADGRVRVIEGFNARNLSQEALRDLAGLEQGPDLVVADLSFISLELILPSIATVAKPSTECILLIKPQFEVGRAGIRNGIVTDLRLADEAVARIVDTATRLGFESRGILESPLTGEHGNQEFLAYFVRGGDA